MENFNLKLNNLKVNIMNIIKNSDIPIGTVYYVLKDLLSNVEDVYKQTIEIERQTSLLYDIKENDENENHQE